MIAQAQLLGSVDPKVFEDLPDAFGEAAEKNSWQWEPAALPLPAWWLPATLAQAALPPRQERGL